MVNKIKENIFVLGIIVLTIIMILLFQAVGFQSYSRYSTDTRQIQYKYKTDRRITDHV